MKLHNDKEKFKKVVIACAANLGIDPVQVEKDYYVSLLLREIEQIKDINFVFKGGTSLSKCYNVIDRFSEDIDLAVLFDEDKLSNSKKEKLKAKIASSVKQAGLRLLNEKEIFSRKDFNRYRTSYEKVFGDNPAVIDHVVIETIVVYKPYPTEEKEVANLLTTYLSEIHDTQSIQKYELQPFTMLVQTVERTFIDKVFAICDYHLQKNYKRHSRHIYDLSKIWNGKKISVNIISDIIGQVIADRQKQAGRNPSCAHGARPLEILREIVNDDVYRDDYNKVTQRFIYNRWSYKLVKRHLIEIINSGLIPDVIK